MSAKRYEEFKTLEFNHRIDSITYSPRFLTICDVSGVPFHGEIEIKYTPRNGVILEFESFEGWLAVQSTKTFTVESFCFYVYENLMNVLDPKCLTVLVHASTTVHANVTVEKTKHD